MKGGKKDTDTGQIKSDAGEKKGDCVTVNLKTWLSLQVCISQYLNSWHLTDIREN